MFSLLPSRLEFVNAIPNWIEVFTCTSLDPDSMLRIRNDTDIDLNPYIIAYSNGNMSMYRNGVYEKFSSIKLVFEVFNYDTIMINGTGYRFVFRVVEIIEEPLLKPVEHDYIDVQKHRVIITVSIVLMVVSQISAGGIIRLISMRRRKREIE